MAAMDWSKPSGWSGSSGGTGGMWGTANQQDPTPWWQAQNYGGMTGGGVGAGAAAMPQMQTMAGQGGVFGPPGMPQAAQGMGGDAATLYAQNTGGTGMDLWTQAQQAAASAPRAANAANMARAAGIPAPVLKATANATASGGNRARAATAKKKTEPVTPNIRKDDLDVNVPGDRAAFGSGNQVITMTQNPWGPQGEGLKGTWKEGEKEYDIQRKLGAPKFSEETQRALQRMEQMATGKNPLVNKALNTVEDITSGDTRINTSNKFNDLYQKASGPGNAAQYNKLYNNPDIDTAGYRQMAGENAITNQGDYERLAANNIGTGQFNQLYGQNVGQGSLYGGAFGDMATGSMIGNNPYREQNIKQSMGDTAKMVKASMSKAGRYGSDAYGDAMGKALSSVATQAREAGFNQDTANMMAAAQARSGETLARGGLAQQAAQGTLSTEQFNRQQQLAAAQGITGLQGANAQQKLAAMQGLTGAQTAIGAQKQAAAQGLTNLQMQQQQAALAATQGLTGVQGQNIANQMQGAAMTPEMQKLRYDDMNRLLGIGATKEAMTAQQRQFGWDQIGNLSKMYGNLPASAGSGQQTTQDPWWKQAAGLGMFGLGLAGMM